MCVHIHTLSLSPHTFSNWTRLLHIAFGNSRHPYQMQDAAATSKSPLTLWTQHCLIIWTTQTMYCLFGFMFARVRIDSSVRINFCMFACFISIEKSVLIRDMTYVTFIYRKTVFTSWTTFTVVEHILDLLSRYHSYIFSPGYGGSVEKSHIRDMIKITE